MDKCSGRRTIVGSSYGIPKGGVADKVAWEQLQSLLNVDSIGVLGPVLECTLKGPRLYFGHAVSLFRANGTRVDGKLVKQDPDSNQGRAGT